MNLKRYVFDIFTFVKDFVDMVSRDGRISTAGTRHEKQNRQKEWGSLNEQA
jgi:hypothetical protein